MQKQVIITFHIKKEKEEAFLNIMQELKSDLPKIDGCLGLNIFKADEENLIVTIIEYWESIEKHKTHIKTVIDSGEWDFINSHLTKTPTSFYYDKL